MIVGAAETMEAGAIQTETMDVRLRKNPVAVDVPAKNACVTPIISVANSPGMKPASKNAPIVEAAEA